MNLVGIEVILETNYSTKLPSLKINKEVIEVEKETAKMYKVKRSGLIFNCLNNILKEDLDKVQKEDYINALRRKIWVKEADFNEDSVISVLKLSLSAELRQRQEFINEAVKLVR